MKEAEANSLPGKDREREGQPDRQPSPDEFVMSEETSERILKALLEYIARDRAGREEDEKAL